MGMAVEISPDQMARYRVAHRAQEAQRRQALAVRLRALRAGAEAAGAVLQRDFGATRVLLFGSAAHGQGIHERSDIDLAVEGIAAHDFWAAGAAAERAAGFALDLVDLTYAQPSLAAHIQETGIEL
jgi:predicted nucleotidyltransferase